MKLHKDGQIYAGNESLFLKIIGRRKWGNEGKERKRGEKGKWRDSIPPPSKNPSYKQIADEDVCRESCNILL